MSREPHTDIAHQSPDRFRERSKNAHRQASFEQVLRRIQLPSARALITESSSRPATSSQPAGTLVRPKSLPSRALADSRSRMETAAGVRGRPALLPASSRSASLSSPARFNSARLNLAPRFSRSWPRSQEASSEGRSMPSTPASRSIVLMKARTSATSGGVSGPVTTFADYQCKAMTGSALPVLAHTFYPCREGSMASRPTPPTSRR